MRGFLFFGVSKVMRFLSACRRASLLPLRPAQVGADAHGIVYQADVLVEQALKPNSMECAVRVPHQHNQSQYAPAWQDGESQNRGNPPLWGIVNMRRVPRLRDTSDIAVAWHATSVRTASCMSSARRNGPLCALMASLSAMQRSHQDVNRPADFTENAPRSETVITCPADFTSFSYRLTRPRCRFSVSRPAQSHSAGLRVSSAAKPRSSRLIAPIIAIQRGGTSVGPWRCPGHFLSAGQYPGRVVKLPR